MPSLSTILAVAFASMLLFSKLPQDSKRIHNFSAGPGMMPTAVMERARDEFVNFQDLGMGFIELSHRDADGPVQQTMIKAEQMYRSMLNIPENYKVLFMHGGAHAQFAAVPLNLLKGGSTADYVVTGHWSAKARAEASKHVPNAREVFAAKDGIITDPSTWDLSPDAAYVHFCASETIDGLEFLREPKIPSKAPLVADFTSTLLSRKVDISKYGLIYASGGKNLGPSGFCLVIVREDLIAPGMAHPNTPSIMNYYVHASTEPIPSIYNTPPTFQLWMALLVLEDLKARGGLEAVEARAIARANEVYEAIDASSGFYRNVVKPEFRSRMSVPFRIGDGRRDLEDVFVKEAAAKGMVQLFGHPVRGGLRITLYNGVPDEAVKAVVSFLKEFCETHRSEL